MKKIPPIPDNKFIRRVINGQTSICFSWKTWVQMGEDWYEIEKHWSEITFPVILKEDKVKRLLAKLA